jgi:hypothetical protein
MSGTLRTIAAVVAVALVTAGGSTAAFVVTSKNIKNGTIQLVDINAKAKKALRGQRGPQGPQGAQGIQAITEVQGPGTIVQPGQFGVAGATCPDGQRPIAGGVEAHPDSAMNLSLSRRSATGWGVSAHNTHPTVQGILFAYVYCSPNVSLLP